MSTGTAEEVVATEPQSEITWQRKCEKDEEVDGQRDKQSGGREDTFH